MAFVVFRFIKQKSYFSPFNILFLFFVIPILGYISAKTNSEGYVLIFFPIVAFMVALFFNRVFSHRLLLIPGLIVLFAIGITNSYSLVSKNYLMKNGYGVPMYERINTVKKIIKESGKEEYNIIGIGEGSQYESFTMGYEYLAWWLGKQPSKKYAKLQFIIRETQNQVILTKNVTEE